MDSPRGRIYLVNQLLDGAPLTAATAEHFDRCLGCMACMTACPSGVQYDQLIEAARVWTEEARSGSEGDANGGVTGNGSAAVDDNVAEVRGADAGAAGTPGTSRAGRPVPDVPSAPKRPAMDRAARVAIFSLFPYPKRLRAVTAPPRGAPRTGLGRRQGRR